MQNLIFIGDSYVAATGDNSGLGWCNRLVAISQQKHPHLSLTHSLLGIGGNTSADILKRWKKEADAVIRPNSTSCLIFAFGLNDCSYRQTGNRALSLAETQKNATDILKEAQKSFPCLMIGPTPVREDRRKFSDVSGISIALEAICTPLAIPYFSFIPLLENNPLWLKIMEEHDGLHPDEKGYSLMAEMIASWPAWNAWLEKNEP